MLKKQKLLKTGDTGKIDKMISCQDNENQLRYQKKKMFGHEEEDNKEKLNKNKNKKTHLFQHYRNFQIQFYCLG